MREWVLIFNQRPWSLNAERTWHYHKRNKIVQVWREGFADLAREQQIPLLGSIEVEALVVVYGIKIPDAGNALPALKAGVDGLVDAGVILDDTPEYVKKISFHAPVREFQTNCLIMKIIERS